MINSKNRFATWALNSKDEKIFVTLELNTENFEVEIRTLEYSAAKEFSEKIEKEWVKGENIEFPENCVLQKRSFTDESILPDDIKIEGKTGTIRQLQNEWSYLLLSTKLFSQFMIELDELKRKAMELTEYSNELFDEAKHFWEKVLEFRKERELSQEKVNGIKEEVNQIFDHLKTLKEVHFREKDERSNRISDEINALVTDAKFRMEQNGVLFKSIMDDLIQAKNKLAKEDVKRNSKQLLFDLLNKTLDEVRAKRDNVLGEGLEGKLQQMQTVLSRVKHSLSIDQKDLEFNQKKLTQTNTRLEEQLREAKIRVLEDKVSEKKVRVEELEEKINSMKSKLSKPKTSDTDVKVIVKKSDLNNENNSSEAVLEQNESEPLPVDDTSLTNIE